MTLNISCPCNKSFSWEFNNILSDYYLAFCFSHFCLNASLLVPRIYSGIRPLVVVGFLEVEAGTKQGVNPDLSALILIPIPLGSDLLGQKQPWPVRCKDRLLVGSRKVSSSLHVVQGEDAFSL